MAASIVLLAAVVLHQGASGPFSAAGGGTVEAASPTTAADQHAAAVPLQQEDRNYDQTAARALGQTTARAAFGGATLSNAQATSGPIPSPVPGAPPNDAAALACLRRAGATFSSSDRLVRLILARYQGRPAYLGVFLEGPPGERPETVAVWVVGAGDCGVRLLTSERI